MARVLFVTPDAGGNVPPTLAIARNLAVRGHEVTVLGHLQLAEVVANAGLAFRPFARARRWSPVVERPGVRSMLGWLRLAADRGIGRDVRGELDGHGADVVVVDCMVPVALRAARGSGAPVAVLMHAFSEYWVRQWAASSPMGAWLRLVRAHPRRHPADLALVTTAPELDLVDPRDIPAAAVVQTGPVLPWRVAPDAETKRRQRTVASPAGADVLVSFSTISYPGQDRAMQRTLDAVAQLPAAAVVTLAASLDRHRLRVPPNVEVRGYVPHAELLPHVGLLVGHGGHGTTMAALALGTPVLVVAMSSHADQPLVGAAVRDAGVGAVLPRESSVERIRDAIAGLLGDEAVAERARLLAARWRERDAVGTAADAIEGLAGTG